MSRIAIKLIRLSRRNKVMPKKFEKKAVRMYVEGNNFRHIGRLFGVNYQSVVNWVNAYREKIKDKTHLPKESATIEMDELWTFVGEKKSKAYKSQLLLTAERIR